MNVSKRFSLLLFLTLGVALGASPAAAQSESCTLKVEAQRQDDDAPATGAVVTATSVESKRIFRANARGVFAKLAEGEYTLTVTKAGYKKSVMTYVLTCVPAENGFVKTSVPLWAGSPRETVSVDDEIQTTEPDVTGRTENDGATLDPQRVKAVSAPGGILNEKATNLVKPPYPAAARAVRASGPVEVQVTIDEAGNVISAYAISGHPLLRASAVSAARASKFAPTTLEGKPVKVTGIIVYNFVP